MPQPPSFRAALAFWLKLGPICFGGPAGQISVMHQELVERKRWIGEYAFLHALSYCNLLPGPEAQQLATYCGWRLHGWRGGVAAGALFVLPSVVALWALSWIYVKQGSVPWVAAAFHGLAAATLGALLTTWVTFLPCFLWIFLGAPWVERLREARALSAALTAISVAVVGVVLNLAAWFGLRLVFPQGLGAGIGAADGFVLALAVGSFVALGWGRLAIHWVVLAGGLLGVARWALA